MKSEDQESANETIAIARPDRLALDNPVLLAMMPVAARPAIRAIWAFDRTVARIVSRGAESEPILAQLRLAWWREEIAGLACQIARPDPVLAALAEFAPEDGEAALVDLLSAWEGLLLAQPFDSAEAISHAKRRGEALAALSCAILDADSPDRPTIGHSWAAADLALHVDDPEIRAALFNHVLDVANSATGMPVALRALTGWAWRIAARQGRPAPLSDQLYLLRMGLVGR